MPATESQIDAPSAGRLVIRIKLIPQEPPPPPLWRRMSKSALLIIGVAALLLSWLVISTFRTDVVPPAAERAANTVVSSPQPTANTTVTSPAEVTPAESQVPQPPTAPPSTITEVLPDVPQSALDTIRGTVRVSVRVIVDQQGRVVRAAAEDRGPSRYFERLSIEASKKWIFTAATSDEQRIMLVRFSFTRAGVTAHASPQ
jgi:outer membrane biosynthesis protein TonB